MAGNRPPTSGWVTPWVNQRSSGSGRTSRRRHQAVSRPLGHPVAQPEIERPGIARCSPVHPRGGRVATRFDCRPPALGRRPRACVERCATIGDMQPFQFLADARDPRPGRELAELARRAEGMGFHALVIPDHLIEQLSPVPAMATIAAATDHPSDRRLRDEQRPAPSGGRRAGPRQPRRPVRRSARCRHRRRLEPARVRGHRHRRSSPPRSARRGSKRPSPSSRAVSPTVRSASPASTTRSPTTTPQPKPVQRPHPPFMIGGGGRRTLELAAREADIIGLAPRISRRASQTLGA